MNKLDLHGVRHNEVSRKLDIFLGEHLTKGSNEVIIIIGHSDQMKKIVDNVLVDYGLTSEFGFLNKTQLIIKLS
jgi:DNA-nicking Smr family endonuclease